MSQKPYKKFVSRAQQEEQEIEKTKGILGTIADKIKIRSTTSLKFLGCAIVAATAGHYLNHTVPAPVLLAGIAGTALAFRKQANQGEKNTWKKVGIVAMALALPVPLALATLSLPQVNPLTQKLLNKFKRTDKTATPDAEVEPGKPMVPSSLTQLVAKVAAMAPTSFKNLLEQLKAKEPETPTQGQHEPH